jgi:tight adherence protein C
MGNLIPQLLNLDPAFLVLGLVVFGFAFLLVFGVRFLLASRVDVIGERVKRSVTRRPSSMPPPAEPVAGERGAFLDTALKPIATVAKPTDEEELGRLRNRLSYAGFRSDRAMYVFLVVKVFLCLLFAGIVLWLNTMRPQPLQYAAFFTVLAMTAGFYFPSMWLDGRIKERQAKVNRALPDALDLLVTCVEAGLGLDAAMNRVAEEIQLSSPILAQEILQAALEIRAGSTRGESFRRLAGRTGVEEIQNLSSIVVQTEVFGTSMAKALRITSEGMRIRRMQLAEERAATVAVKMTIPLVLCIMPSLFAVIMGPAAIKIFKMLIPTLGGG